MYSENTIFCTLFKNNFTRDVCNKIISKQKADIVWELWKLSSCNTASFFNQINFYDKMNFHHWFMMNIVQFINNAKIQIPEITSFSLTKPLCDELFPKCSDVVWDIWINHANENPEKFISLVNIKYKLCMTLWQSNNV